MSTNLDQWGIFGLLDAQLKQNIRLAVVFGNQAIFVTRDDEVFGLGANTNGCLGTGNNLPYLQPQRIPLLCGQQVISFACGPGPHVIALTDSGAVYSWGLNTSGELGIGAQVNTNTPTQIAGLLQGKKVVQVACGGNHSLALTSDGEVFGWGQNSVGQVGLPNYTHAILPQKVAGLLTGRFVTSIACGSNHSIAVLDSGEVFTWGSNVHGQLGLGNNVSQSNPCKIAALHGIVISRVVCGNNHTLALSDAGYLYAWGANNVGQLGNGTKVGAASPIAINSEMGRVSDISACMNSNTSAAMNENNRVFMWGSSRCMEILTPTLTPLSSLDDVFAKFSSDLITYRLLSNNVETNDSVKECLRNSFNNSDTADFVIKVDGREIKVHKAFLIMRCNHFRTMFEGEWKESQLSEIAFDQFSYDAYYAFFEYLYTDEVDLSPEMAIELLILADSVLEFGLKSKCEKIIMNGLMVDNVASLYGCAIRFKAKALEDFCFKFSLNHMTAVVMSDGFKSLDEDVVKNYMYQAAQKGAFKY